MALTCRHIEVFSALKENLWKLKPSAAQTEPLKGFLCLSGAGCQRPLPRGGEAERLGSRCLNRDFHTSCSICSQHSDHSVGGYCQPQLHEMHNKATKKCH